VGFIFYQGICDEQCLKVRVACGNIWHYSLSRRDLPNILLSAARSLFEQITYAHKKSFGKQKYAEIHATFGFIHGQNNKYEKPQSLISLIASSSHRRLISSLDSFVMPLLKELYLQSSSHDFHKNLGHAWLHVRGQRFQLLLTPDDLDPAIKHSQVVEKTALLGLEIKYKSNIPVESTSTSNVHIESISNVHVEPISNIHVQAISNKYDNPNPIVQSSAKSCVSPFKVIDIDPDHSIHKIVNHKAKRVLVEVNGVQKVLLCKKPRVISVDSDGEAEPSGEASAGLNDEAFQMLEEVVDHVLTDWANVIDTAKVFNEGADVGARFDVGDIGISSDEADKVFCTGDWFGPTVDTNARYNSYDSSDEEDENFNLEENVMDEDSEGFVTGLVDEEKHFNEIDEVDPIDNLGKIGSNLFENEQKEDIVNIPTAGQLVKGMELRTMEECRKFFKAYGIQNRFNFRHNKNDEKRNRIWCCNEGTMGEECQFGTYGWYAWCSATQDHHTVKLRKFNDTHTFEADKDDKYRHARAP
ncbi:hypothetical protein IFM89_014480, partial [Coptis chinensis]